MGKIDLSIGQIGITNYLLINLRKTTDPLAIYDSQSFGPAPSATINFVFPDIDPVVYFVDYRNSPNGVALGTLLGTFVVDAASNKILAETRYYLVGSGLENHPAPDQPDLVDPYLDGKTLLLVHKEGFRPLVPPSETFKEYDLIDGGGITLLNGNVWGDGEVVVITISWLGVQQDVAGPGSFTQVADIGVNTTLNSTHNNKRLRCEGTASVRLVVTMPDINDVPEGTAYLCMSNQGLQFQTKFLPAAGQVFRFGKYNYPEFWLHKGCSFIIEKRIINSVAVWEVYNESGRIREVGKPTRVYFHDLNNPTDPTASEDIKVRNGLLYDGDDWPAIWWVINNLFLPNQVHVDDNVTSGGYTHPADKRGLFVKHSTQKKFRVPNSLNLFERNIKSTAYATDPQREYDYPGGIQEEMIGQHTHGGLNIRSGSHSGASSPLTGNIKFLVNTAGDAPASQPDATTGGVVGSPIENRPENEAQIPMIYF